MRKIIWLFIFFVQACQAQYQYQLSICAIFQDEAPYLKEWIEFHRLVGVEHFYLYNHCSQDHYKEVLQPYIVSGLVELKEELTTANTIEAFNPLQCKCYTDCLNRSKGVSKWVAFLDVDEYLFPLEAQSLPEMLKSYEDFGGVGVNWRIFGTAHIKQIPQNQLLIETLIRCSLCAFPANMHVKSIVRPERATHFMNPHHPIYCEGYFAVNADKIPFEGRFSPYVRTNKLRINHYWTRDEDYFYQKKIARQKKWGGTPNPEKLLRDMNQEEDKLILRYVPALRGCIQTQKGPASKLFSP